MGVSQWGSDNEYHAIVAYYETEGMCALRFENMGVGMVHRPARAPYHAFSIAMLCRWPQSDRNLEEKMHGTLVMERRWPRYW